MVPAGETHFEVHDDWPWAPSELKDAYYFPTLHVTCLRVPQVID